MKTLLTLLALLVITAKAHAGSAIWKLNPPTSDWDNAANWRPRTVPNGPNDIATFAVSNTTNVSLPPQQREVDAIVFSPGASAFTIITDDLTTSPLVLSGT